MKNVTDCISGEFIPVVFSFDRNFVIPACVCITSLLYNAGKADSYRVFCLIDTDVSLKDRKPVECLFKQYPGHELVFIPMEDAFSEAHTQWAITKPTYYRLLIPRILSEYKKVIYADVDIIFKGSLSDLYFHEDVSNVYLGAVKDVNLNLRVHTESYSEQVGCGYGHYFNAGFLVMNIEQINKDHLSDLFLELEKKHYLYMDQDILNIACKDKVRFLTPAYNGLNSSYFTKEDVSFLWTEAEFAEYGRVVRHYVAAKPWRRNVADASLWWSYYWRLPFLHKIHYRYLINYCEIMIRACLSPWKRRLFAVLGR